jgi:hypothetical protein
MFGKAIRLLQMNTSTMIDTAAALVTVPFRASALVLICV